MKFRINACVHIAVFRRIRRLNASAQSGKGKGFRRGQDEKAPPVDTASFSEDWATEPCVDSGLLLLPVPKIIGLNGPCRRVWRPGLARFTRVHTAPPARCLILQGQCGGAIIDGGIETVSLFVQAVLSWRHRMPGRDACCTKTQFVSEISASC